MKSREKQYLVRCLRYFVGNLRRRCPTNMAVVVRRTSFVGKMYRYFPVYADAQKKKGYYLIRINKNIRNIGLLSSVLVHEWSHVVDDRWQMRQIHDSKWGRFYAKVHRAIFDAEQEELMQKIKKVAKKIMN